MEKCFLLVFAMLAAVGLTHIGEVTIKPLSYDIRPCGAIRNDNYTVFDSLEPIATRIKEYERDVDTSQVNEPVFIGDMKCPTTFTVQSSTSYRVIEIDDCLVDGYGTVFKDNNYYVQQKACHFDVFRPVGKVVDLSSETVIAIAHDYSNAFGHWPHETFAKLFAIDKEVLNKSTVLIGRKAGFATSSLNALGVNKVLVGKAGRYYKVKTAIIVDTYDCCKSNPYLIQEAKKFYRKAFNLSDAPPKKCVVQQRRRTRVMKNHQEILDTFRREFPWCNWETVASNNDLRTSANYYNDVLVYFGIHGGAMSNLIFMKPGTVVFEIHSPVCSECFYGPTVYGGLKFYEYIDNRIEHFKRAEYYIDPVRFTNIMREILIDVPHPERVHPPKINQ